LEHQEVEKSQIEVHSTIVFAHYSRQSENIMNV